MGEIHMKKMMQLATVLGVSVGIFGLANVAASANSQYSAKRSNSVRLVWRTNMRRHACTATQGAHHSKHLGIRYSNNDVTQIITWYTDAHEKLYKKYKGHNAIYYHVKSVDGALKGWIWRGYLKSVATSNNGKSSSSSMNQTDLERWVLPKYEKLSKLKFINFFSKDPTSEKAIEQVLVKVGYDQNTRSSYQGWSVGGAALGSDSFEEGTEPGKGLIFLIQK
ncbi:hypothetical protein FC61_GL001274 [Levilactobacillus brevis ATCC 14869 = DSM 20054]|nr:hypothetical protein FC61_GL001274 [Levilactobacillus brevis ATCC 14869 = DSM 20054]